MEFCRVFCCLIPKSTSIWKWKVWVGLARYHPALNLDRKPSFLYSNQARLKCRLLSYASCSVSSQSSFFMIQIYRCYKMCMLLSLFIEPSYFSYLICYTNGIIIVQNEWHIFIHPSCTPCCGYVPCTIFWVFTSDRYTKKFKKIRQQHVWHEIVSWDCRFKYVISTCRLCHGTAMSGYQKYVGLKMDGLLEPWQTLKYEVCCDFCVWCVLHQ